MKYFTISEFIKSDTALKMRLWNGANKEIEENIRSLVDEVLDPLRERYGRPIYVISGYRCPKLNNLVNGAPNSQHMRGEAADITGGSPAENLKLAQMIAESGKFDQMILEEVGPNDLLPQWIHITWKRKGWNRKNILKKVAGKAGYITVDIANSFPISRKKEPARHKKGGYKLYPPFSCIGIRLDADEVIRRP